MEGIHYPRPFLPEMVKGNRKRYMLIGKGKMYKCINLFSKGKYIDKYRILFYCNGDE